MKILSDFSELLHNAEYFGSPSPWDEFEADSFKEAVEILEKLVLGRQQELDKQLDIPQTPEERQLRKKTNRNYCA